MAEEVDEIHDALGHVSKIVDDAFEQAHFREIKLIRALEEVQRRTAMLIHQNTGLWKMSVEHDRRTTDVLGSNQDIIAEALAEARGEG